MEKNKFKKEDGIYIKAFEEQLSVFYEALEKEDLELMKRSYELACINLGTTIARREAMINLKSRPSLQELRAWYENWQKENNIKK